VKKKAQKLKCSKAKIKKLKTLDLSSLVFKLFSFSIALALTFSACQKKDEPKKKPEELPLRAGELRDVRWPRPVIVAVADTVCSDTIICPAKSAECILKTFRVPKDTLYVLTTSYFNGDTLAPSCRACATVYEDTVVVKNRVTACPTGGAWVGSMNLRAGVDYLLAVSLQRCPVKEKCACGEGAIAEAAVSLGRQF
jgi:hypothetical protein